MQYDDRSLATLHENIPRSVFTVRVRVADLYICGAHSTIEGEARIENYSNYKKRWRYNRLMVYMRALRAAGLIVVPMRAQNGYGHCSSLG